MPARPAPELPNFVLMRPADAQCWIFDLDNTLYPASCRLFDQVERRIGEFVQQLLNLEPEAARALQKQYFRDHQTTLNGLMGDRPRICRSSSTAPRRQSMRHSSLVILAA